MAFMGCAGSQGACLQAVEEAVKENALTRLSALLAETSISVGELDRKNLLHRAAWLGYPTCVRMLLDAGAAPDDPHRKNGCTPLHLAHFCTVDDSNPAPTIAALVDAGASVNNAGGEKCGRLPLDHAIQHQRLHSVTALLSAGSIVTQRSVLSAIDVASPQILQLLLISGGKCGAALETTVFWGRPLDRLLYAPLKGPKECYRQMFTMLVQATVCRPAPPTASVRTRQRPQQNGEVAAGLTYQEGPTNTHTNTTTTTSTAATASQATDSATTSTTTTTTTRTTTTTVAPATHNDTSRQGRGGGAATASITVAQQDAIEAELKTLAKHCVEPTVYLYVHLVRNGFMPSAAARTFIASLTDVADWVDDYLASPAPLRDLCTRVTRSYLYRYGNVIGAVNKLGLPPRVRDIVVMYNPLN